MGSDNEVPVLISIPGATLVLELRKLGEVAFERKYPYGFLEVVFTPPATAQMDDGNTAGTRLGGGMASKDPSLPASYIPLTKSDPDSPHISVGRSEKNDVVIRAWGISKRHAVFLPSENGDLLLMDVGSSNGTTVNGESIGSEQRVKLFTGDVISFWWYVFEFVYLKHLIKSLQHLR
jgi:hypothetical protein